MSDRPDKQQMMKMFVPAVAIAVVILLVGVLVAMRDNPDTSGPGGGKPIPGAPGKGSSRKAGPGFNVVPVDAEGLSQTKPPQDAPEWTDIGDGLKTWDVKEGTGEVCDEGATVQIHYAGWTLAGKLFDSTYLRGKPPAEFPLSRLIQGWQRGIPGMKPGGIRRLYIPWAMAYGEGGSPPDIPPKADLIFEIKLFGFQ